MCSYIVEKTGVTGSAKAAGAVDADHRTRWCPSTIRRTRRSTTR